MKFNRYKYFRLCMSLMLAFLSVIAYGQQESRVAGKVLDAYGDPIEGVQVSVYGVKGEHTSSGADGSFSLSANNTKGAIKLSFAGYKEQTVYLNGRTQVNVVLRETGFASASDPVQWVGKSMQADMIPYAHVTLRAEDLMDRGYLTLSDAIAENAPGVYAGTLSGNPGAGRALNIRGVSSLNANTRPVIVVDGVIFENRLGQDNSFGGPTADPLAFFKVNNIKSVTVIKDGGSALYGAMGANGAILIETNRSVATKTTVDVDTEFGVSLAPEKMPVLNAKQFQNYALEQMLDQGMTYDQIKTHYPFMVNEAEGAEYYTYKNDTDWQDRVLQNGSFQKYSAYVRGGDNVATYAGTAGYAKSEGVVKNTEFERFDFGLNADMRLLKNLTLRPNVLFVRSTGMLRSESANRITNPLLAALNKSPMMTAYRFSEDGWPLPHYQPVGAFGVSNPQDLIDNTKGEFESFRTLANVDGAYALTPSIGLYFNGGFDLLKYGEDSFVPSAGTLQQRGGLVKNSMGHMERAFFSTYFNGGVNYNKTFGQGHTVSARAGVRSKMNDLRIDFAMDGNSSSDVFTKVGMGDQNYRTLLPSGGKWNTFSVEAAADYAYLNKYMVSANLLSEGNSRFDKDYRFGLFYSVAGAWRLSSESFLSGISALNDLKLRASYGVSGNDDIGNINSVYYYRSVSYGNIGGLVRANVPNYNVKWEETAQVNVGLDLAIFNERVKVTADYFESKTDDLLGSRLLPTYYGSGVFIANGGSLKNSGFELGLTGRLIESKDLDLDLGLNFGSYKNEVTALPSYASQVSGESGSSQMLITPVLDGATVMKVGESINAFYGHKTLGIFSNDAEASKFKNQYGDPYRAGDIRFQDMNNDGVIDDADRTVIGNPNPEFYGSVSLNARYKRFRAGLTFDYAVGGDIYNYVRRQQESMSDYSNQSTAVLNRWRKEGDKTDIPRASFGDRMGNARFSDRWLEDGSFVRLRSLTILYALPLPKNKIVRSVDVKLAAQNLFTVSNYLGFTPDVMFGNGANQMGIDAGRFPMSKSLMAGIKIGI